MRGKQVVMDALVGHGVDLIFGNPGTTESPLIDALLDYPQLRYIVSLHEGVALGAASYYAQASGRVGVVNLHVAPGLGNALGMLYDAAKAGSPLVVTAGQQDTRMRLRAPILGHDLVAMAAPLVKWSVQAERADELGLLMRRAFKVATDPPAGPVFVALPIDVLEQETENGAELPGVLYRAPAPDPAGVAAAAHTLLASRRPALVVGDDVARARAHEEVVALAEALGAGVYSEGIRQHVAFPSSHPNWRQPLPFDAAAIRAALEGCDAVLLAGGSFFEEVWFAPGSPIPARAAVVQIEESPRRLAPNLPVTVGLITGMKAGLAALLAAIEANADPAFRVAARERNAALAALRQEDVAAQRARAERRGSRLPMSTARLMAELAQALPHEAIVVDESITASVDLWRTLSFEHPGDYHGARGGGIGQALPGALGVKLAHPDRPVVAISGDGSAMYSIQALWTAAHDHLAVVYVILSNREYRILKHNMDTYRQRFGAKPDRAYLHMDLAPPEIGFVEMAKGMGVAAERVTRTEEVAGALARALASGGPYLLDIVVEGKA